MTFRRSRILIGLFLSIFSIYIFTFEAKAFCFDTTELSGELEPLLNPGSDYYGVMSQGFCVADNRIIYTRYTSDSSATTYVILDAETMEEIGHQSFNTQHSNSLTYNTKTKEVVSVSNNHAYVFSFDGTTLSLEHDHYMKHNCPKIAYVSEEDAYYLGTSTEVFKTHNFESLDKVFSVPQIAVNQGMGSDGKHLFIVWYQEGYCCIYEYTTEGNHIETYTLHSDTYREIEEVDFYGQHMLLSIENSGSEKNGLYQVKNHHIYGKWKVTKEATCGDDGCKERTCERCGYVAAKRIPLTEKHTAGEWKTLTEATCTETGKQIQNCSVCDTRLNTKIIPATGHDFGEWQVEYAPTVYESGYQSRKCKNCSETQQEVLPRLNASITMDTSKATVWLGEVIAPRCVKLENGDHIKCWSSDNPSVVKVDDAGTIYALHYGSAHISCISNAGKIATYTVTVSRLCTLQHWFTK